MTGSAYLAAVVLACACLVGVLVASSTVLDEWLDARARRARDRRELEAWRAFRDGGWPR